MNKNLRYILFVMSALCVLSVTQAGFWSWLGYSSAPAPITQNDRDLLNAVNRGDEFAVRDLLAKNANPNAKIDGDRSIFIEAFERALVRNDEGKIMSVDGARAEIVYSLVTKKGAEDLNKYIEARYMVRGRPVLTLFKENYAVSRNIALEVFSRFVNYLREIAKGSR
jgi:hypothetical protein